MGEIDQLNDAVNHRVAEGDQSVDTAADQAAADQFEKIFHELFNRLADAYRRP